jgi:peptide/nickel transport system substrate-binding protein
VKRALSETSDMGDYVSSIEGVTALDDHTVLITTAAPDPILPDELSMILMMSKRWAGSSVTLCSPQHMTIP